MRYGSALWRLRFPGRQAVVTVLVVAVLYPLAFVMKAAGSDNETVSVLADLPAEARELVTDSARRFLADLRPQPRRSANLLGYDCMTAAILVRAGMVDSRARLLRSVNDLLTSAMKRPNGAFAWRATSNPTQEAKCGPGGWETFGVCNGPDTAYGFQSGVAIACLSEAGAVLNDDQLLQTAQRSFHYWDTHRGWIPDCNKCLYYWGSEQPEAKGRYVRNLSLFLGFAAASLARHTGENGLADIARDVARSDIWEQANGNHGYLGQLDPLWHQRPGEADRIENHMAAVAMLLDGIGRDVDMPEARVAGLAAWHEWATCSNKACRMKKNCHYWGGDPNDCAVWSTYTHCAFRRRSQLANRLCLEALARANVLPPFGLLAVVVGGR